MMEFTANMQRVMERAVGAARKGRHRYFTPEHLIYGMTFDEDFSQEYGWAGGDIELLRRNLLDYLGRQCGVLGENEENIRLTSDAGRVLQMAEEQAKACLLYTSVA